MKLKFEIKNTLGFIGVILIDKDKPHSWQTITRNEDTKENRTEAEKLKKTLNQAFNKFKVNKCL